jgi:hypothetical protein
MGEPTANKVMWIYPPPLTVLLLEQFPVTVFSLTQGDVTGKITFHKIKISFVYR